MTLFRRAARRDGNEAAIVELFTVAGCRVWRLSAQYTPDLLVGDPRSRRFFLAEVKRGRLRKDQADQDKAIRDLQQRGLPVFYVRTADDALAALREVRDQP